MRVLLLSLLCVTSCFAQETKILRAGAATSNLTPDIGGDVIGGFHPFPSTHIHDDLHARCLVLDNGDTKLAIVVCDLLGLSQATCDEAARLVQKHCGLPRESFVVSGTHTHSAMSAMGTDRFKLPFPPLDDYQRFVARRIADGVKRAMNNLAPARIGWTTAEAPEHVFNRRWFLKEGTMPLNPFGKIDKVKMNPGAGNANLIKPAGPTDPQIGLLSVQSRDGKPLAVLANYSLHYVGDVGAGHVSADYFAVFSESLKQLISDPQQDPPFIAMMSNGTSGNINNVNFLQPGKRGEPYSKINAVGRSIAQTVQAALKGVTYHDWVPLGARFRDLECRTREVTPEMRTWATERLATPRALNSKATLELIYAERALRLADYPPKIPVPLQALRIGDCGITTSPFETFVETGLALKKASPFSVSFTIELAGGYYGYLPTPEQHELGGYETWLGTNRVAPDTSVKLETMLNAMVQELAAK
jgi:neutral ceramidase